MSKIQNDLPNTEAWIEGYSDSYSAGWLQNMRMYFQRRTVLDFFSDKVAPYLDVGCGGCRFLNFILNEGFRDVRGVEPDWRLVPEKFHSIVEHAGATALPFPDQHFQCVSFLNVLHHLERVEDYPQALAEADRVLRPGGIMAILEPNNRRFYDVLKYVAQVLAPLSKTWRGMKDILKAEEKTLALFFDNQQIINDRLHEYRYIVKRDSRILHQWIFVLQKPL